MAALEAVDAAFTAAREGNAGEVARLLDAEPGLLEATRPTHGRSLLCETAEHGHVDVVRVLLGRGANINSECRHPHRTRIRPIWSAASEGHFEVVDLLLRSGAETSWADGTWRRTALMAACESGAPAVTRLVLQYTRAQALDETDDTGDTALWSACYSWCAGSVRALLLAGADHTIVDNVMGDTPRQLAQRPENPPNPCALVFEVRGLMGVRAVDKPR
jgi:E3 ubiquitin-protein ligase XBAT32/33